MTDICMSQDATPPSPPHVDACLLLVAILWLAMALQLGTTLAAQRPMDFPPLSNTLNPNTAPWWELAVLPRIGPGIARTIVEHRVLATQSARNPHNRPVFQAAQDLQRIRGIGPKTVQRITPYLRLSID